MLAGCQTMQPMPKEIMVPVQVPCLERLPDAPATASDAELAALDDFRLVLTLARDRAALTGAYGELRAMAKACVR